MKLNLAPVIELLHSAAYATLATHATQSPGYPYASVLPFVVDDRQRPLLLVSALAEHTKNLLDDPRVSLSVLTPNAVDVQAEARLTLLGDAEPVEPDPLLLARYLRYQPEAEKHLGLDFMFFRVRPQRLRYIGGIGRMGWLSAEDWHAAPALSLADEKCLLDTLQTAVPNGANVLGVDCFGIDYRQHGERRRRAFALTEPAAVPELAELERFLRALD